jgi:hypothetical protein
MAFPKLGEAVQSLRIATSFEMVRGSFFLQLNLGFSYGPAIFAVYGSVQAADG